MGRLTELIRKGFPLRCSFCRRNAADRLVAGASAYICERRCPVRAVLGRHENVARLSLLIPR